MKIRYPVNITTWFVVGTAVIWLLYDLWALYKGVKTISFELTQLSYYTPLVPFVMGLLAGHWFWPVEVERNK